MINATSPQGRSQHSWRNEAPIVQTRGLTKMFGSQTAVGNLTFLVPRGTIFGFIGPSGCGKTTTIRLLTGIYRPTEGEAIVLGANPLHFPRNVRQAIGYMPQLFVLYPDLSVWENLVFASAVYGLGWKNRKRMRELLEFVELDEHASKPARKISGGMQRRLSLAATLVHDPELLFLDEPTAGIDPVLRARLWGHFKDLQREGKTLFVATQYVGEATNCDLIGIMDKGRMVMVDTPENLRSKALGGDVINLVLTSRLGAGDIESLKLLPFVNRATQGDGGQIRIIVANARTALHKIVDWAHAKRATIESIEQYVPPFDEVLVELLN